MAKAIALLLGAVIYLFVTIGASIVSMIYGWGIEPQNWWIISIGYILIIAGTVFNVIVNAALKD